MTIGIHNEGSYTGPLKKLDEGYVVPDVSLSELHEYRRQAIREQVEFGVTAEALDFDYVLQPENHFDVLMRNSPCPLDVQTAIAGQTDEIRLVQMANILPWHNPIHVAERTATLDVISDGRAEVGIGTGSGAREIAVFGNHIDRDLSDRELNWELFTEYTEILLNAWTEDRLEYDGDHYQVPPKDVEVSDEHERLYLEDRMDTDSGEVDYDDESVRTSLSVFPQPVQEPHPQVWHTVANSRAAAWAAINGFNGCTFGIDFSQVETLIDTYVEFAEEGGWFDSRPEYDGVPFERGWDADRRRGILAQGRIFNTEVATEETFKRFKRGLEMIQTSEELLSTDENDEETVIDGETYIRERDFPIVGTTEEIIDQIATFVETCGYDGLHMFFSVDSLGLTHEENLQQLRAFTSEVLPYFESSP